MPRPGQAEPARGLKVVALGERARRALGRSGGIAKPLQGFDRAPYYAAGSEIVWIGTRVPAMHPRVVVTRTSPPQGLPFRLAEVPSGGWSARLPRLDNGTIGKVMARAEALRAALVASETPRGFGSRLAAISPSFPLDLANPQVDALARAFERDDAGAALKPARALLGVGAGLTPSGDDLVGGALFGRRWIAPEDRRWADLAHRLAREIRTRSHAVSAALFADLAAGCSFAPLHETADALAAGDSKSALAAARTLAAIGHSSGWDMLAGFFIGVRRIRARRS